MTKKVISLADYQKKKPSAPKSSKKKAKLVPLDDKISFIWLFCPQCKIMQYTLTSAPQGRRHNQCQSIVEETEVKISVLDEYAYANHNLHLAKDILDNHRGEISEEEFSNEVYYLRQFAIMSADFISFLRDKLPEYNYPDSAQLDILKIKTDAENKSFQIDKWGLIIACYIPLNMIDPLSFDE